MEKPPCPEKPEQLDADSAAQFAVDFERTYTAQQIYDDYDDESEQVLIHHSLNNVPSSPSNATALDDGYLYAFPVWEAMTIAYKRSDEGDMVGDEWYNVLYFVSNGSVYRMEQPESNEFEEPYPDPRENGTAVTCPPSGN